MTLTALQADAQVWPRLRDRLRTAGYTEAQIVEQLGGVEQPKREAANLPRLLHRTRGGSPLEVLLRLFLFDVPVAREAAVAALTPVPLELLAEAGILSLSDGFVRANVAITPVDGFLVAVDLPSHFVSGGASEAVVGISNSSRLLADATVRRPVRRALDLGTGNGFQALHAATHSKEVLALDVNSRAALFTRINALLNDLPNIMPLVGDGYAPVAGQQFDLIVGNLPFVVSPGQRFVYRDSTLGRDEFARRIFADTPALLAEGGFGHFLASWVHFADQDGDERLAAVFDGSGCDVWVAVTDIQSPDEYAEKWISNTELSDDETLVATFDEWLSYYEREGITRISTGLIGMRRDTSKPNWFRIEQAPPRESPVGSFGESVAELYARNDLSLSFSDEELLAAPLRVSEHLQLTQHSLWRDGEWHPESFLLRLNEPLLQRGTIDATTLALLTRCDGRPLGQSIAALAEALRVPVSRIAPQVLPLARQWLQLGFLRRA